MAAITRFTPPASCTGLQFGTLTSESGIAIRQGVNCRQPEGRLYWDNDCLPVTNPPIAAGCPVGWSSATSLLSSVACCPSFYTFARDATYSCRLVLSAITTVSVTFCNTDNRANTVVPSATFASGSNFFARAVFLTSPAPTPTIIITTTAVLSSRPGPNSSSSTATSADNVNRTSTAAIPTTPVDPGLSGGAIAGIVIGAVTLLVLLAATAFICIRRRKRRTSAQLVTNTPIASTIYTDTKPELAATTAAAGVGAGAGYYAPHNKHHAHPIASSPSPPSELSGVASPYSHPTQPAWNLGPAQQHPELAAHSQSNGAASLASHYVESTGPYYPEFHATPDQEHASRLAELEIAQRELEERMARVRHLGAMEEEHSRTQAEIARLRNN